MNDKRPAWREPMVWLVVALPLVAVIAGFALLVIASRSGSTDAVADRVQRTAQIQVADLGPDARARQLRLSAILRTDGDLVEVLPVSGDFPRDAPLRLALHHPARSATSASAGTDRATFTGGPATRPGPTPGARRAGPRAGGPAGARRRPRA